LPEGLIEAAESFMPERFNRENLVLCRIADTTCYGWAYQGCIVSQILIEELQGVVSVVG